MNRQERVPRCPKNEALQLHEPEPNTKDKTEKSDGTILGALLWRCDRRYQLDRDKAIIFLRQIWRLARKNARRRAIWVGAGESSGTVAASLQTCTAVKSKWPTERGKLVV